MDGGTDRQTDGPTDQRRDGRTRALIESLRRDLKKNQKIYWARYALFILVIFYLYIHEKDNPINGSTYMRMKTMLQPPLPLTPPSQRSTTVSTDYSPV